MNDKTQSRPAVRAGIAEGGTAADANQEDAMLGDLPDGMAPLPTVPDAMVTELLALAEQLVGIARMQLGPQSSKPRLKRVEELFRDKARQAPKVDEELDKSIRSLGSVAQVAGLDQSYDQAMATAFNAFDKTSVDAGSNVQQAYDDWTLGVRLYKAASRSAGAILSAAIDNAKNTASGVATDSTFRDRAQLEYYTRSAAIATALLTYEKSMAKASTDLAAAFGKLISGLYGGFTQVAVGEATLLSAGQAASLSFWTKLHSDRSQSRK